MLHVSNYEGMDEEIPYDRLVVSVGSISRTLPVPGLAEHGVGFKTLAEALALHNRVLGSMEIAETAEDRAERAARLTFVFVGAGYAGLEALAELQDFASDVLDLYPRCRIEGMRWILVEARERVMPEIPSDLAAFATRELQRRGIEIMTETTVEEVGADRVRLSTGEVVPTYTCVDGRRQAASGGPPPRPSARGRGAHRGRRVRAGARSRRRVGDGDDAAQGARSRGEGPGVPAHWRHAVHQGKRVADNVAASLGSGRRRPFTYKTLGVRRHGALQARGEHPGGQVARLPGMAAGAHLSRLAATGHRPQAAPGGRLHGQPVLPTRLRRAGPARPSAAARRRPGLAGVGE